MAVRAVLWDADGVLQQGVASWSGALDDLVGEGLEAFTAAVWGELDRALDGRLDMAAHVDEVIDRLGLTGRRERILEVWGTLDPLPDARALVTAVREAGVPCYLATNQDSLRASYMRRLLRYDELLDGTYYSCEVGVAKPRPAYFHHIADDLGVSPTQMLFVDDQPENVAAAREVGLLAEHWHHDEGVEELRRRLLGHGVPL